MKNTLLSFVVSGSLLLWLGSAHAGPPRFDSWGSWDDKTPLANDRNMVLSAVEAVSTEKPAVRVPTEQETKQQETKKQGAKKQDTKKRPVVKKPASKMAPPVSSAKETVTTVGPPTKSRRISSSSKEDRLMPTPEPKVIVIPGQAAKKTGKEEDLSWWERWRRKRQGIPLKPIYIPDSHVYTVRMQEGKWRVTATRLECKLSQVVPHLGQALFQQSVGTALEFKLALDRHDEQIHQARFEAIPPTWGHQQHRQAMSLPASVHKSTLTVPRAGAMRLINQLLEGMDPRVTYRTGADENSDEVEVTLSALTFADKLAGFQHCVNHLLPFKFDEVKESIVYFNFDSARLTAKAQKALARVAEYVRLDKAVKRIVIAGYTDSKGFRRYNYRLATQRARAVEKFFLAHGITKSRLNLSARAFGEKKPAASNRSAKGRAQNRRVHVTLFK